MIKRYKHAVPAYQSFVQFMQRGCANPFDFNRDDEFIVIGSQAESISESGFV
jgi:hypothetical protein